MKFSFLSIFLCLTLGYSASAQHQLSQSKAELLYQKGYELIAHENYGAARQVFSEFLNYVTPTDSRRGEAEYYVAFSALSLGHSDGEKLIDNFITNNPANPRAATAYYDLANFFYNEKNYTKAVVYYKKVNFPALSSAQQSEGHFKWGYSYFNQKKLDEALEQFNFVKKQSNAYSPAANYYAGFIEYTKGQYEEALTDLKKAEGNASYAAVVPYIIANVYYKQGRYDDLIAYGTVLKSRTDITNGAEVSMLIAEAYYFKGDYQNAAAAYEKFLAENPEKAGSALLFRAGYANYSLQQDTKAVAYLSKAAASKDSTSYYASYYLGILYLKQGDKPLALNAFDFARSNPKDKKLAEESSFQYGKVSYDAGKQDQAINEFERFLKLYPSSTHSVEVRELLAQAYVNGNNFNKAIEYIESLPSRNAYIDQAFQKATYLKGAELFNKEQYAEAVSYFEKSLQNKKDPAYTALASFWVGEAYSIGKKDQEAIKSYQQVITLGASADPEVLIKTRYALGYAYFNSKDYEKALFNFKEFTNNTTKGNPNYTDALVRLADCYYVSKQYADALNTYNRARDIGSSDNDYVLFQTGRINGVQRNYSASRTDLEALIRNYPKSQYRDEAMFQRGQLEIEQGNYQVAADAFSQLIRESANSNLLPFAYTRRASSYSNLKQYDKAIADYTTVLKQFPTHPEAQESLLPLQEAMSAAGKAGDFENYLAAHKKANPENKGLESVEFEASKKLYFDQLYSRAVVNLKNFVSSYPQSPNITEAKFYMAESYYRLPDFDNALPIYQELNTDVNYDKGSRVAARMGEILFKKGRYDEAIKSFHKLEKLAANKKEQSTAWSGLMESFFLQNQYDSSDVYARVVLERGNVNAGAQNKASLYLGKSAFARGDIETAKDEFLNTLNSAQDEYGAEAKYLLGLIFYQQKEYKQSYETLTGLNTDFGAYEEWVGKSFLLLADNFLAQNDTFNARTTLQSLVDKFPLQHIKDEAKRKLKEIEKNELAKQKAIEADTLDN